MPTFIFAMKQYLHLYLLWSHPIICFCNEAVLALFFFFPIKLPQHFICIEATCTLHSYWSCANTHFCHEVTITLHLHRSCANVQHFIRIEAMKLRQQFIFVMKPWQHSTLAPKSCLKSCQYLFLPWDHVNTSFAPKLCQCSSLSWSHDNTPH